MFPQPDRYHQCLPETVWDVMYDGHAEYEKAQSCRVTHRLLIWNFELFASQNDLPNLKKLADFTIENYYPQIKGLTNRAM
jgi:uncharacterized protein YdiU (UPF0061 family)